MSVPWSALAREGIAEPNSSQLRRTWPINKLRAFMMVLPFDRRQSLVHAGRLLMKVAVPSTVE
jgi:hypothetical protein